MKASKENYNAELINHKRFLALRNGINIKREQLAIDLGVSSSAVWNVESDKTHNPSINLVLKYMKYFNVKFDELLNANNVELGD